MRCNHHRWTHRSVDVLRAKQSAVRDVRSASWQLLPQNARTRSLQRISGHQSKPLVGVHATADVDQQLPNEEEKQTEGMRKSLHNWWPVQLIYNLHTDRPNRIQSLGEFFVAWKSKKGEWVVMKDMCPHRLAPLSEGIALATTGNRCTDLPLGRIEEDGTLMCSYHGWRFNDCGRCVKIPQADDANSHEIACNSRRASAKTFPSREAAGILWIWPDASDSSFLDAACTSLPIPDSLMDALDRELKEGRHPVYTQTVPHASGALMTNILDPSLRHFSHEGNFTRPRNHKTALRTRFAESVLSSALESTEYEPLVGAQTEHGHAVNEARLGAWYPCAQQESLGTRVLITPVDRNKARIFICDASPDASSLTLQTRVSSQILDAFPWMLHLRMFAANRAHNTLQQGPDKQPESDEQKPQNSETLSEPISTHSILPISRKPLFGKAGVEADPEYRSMPDLSQVALLDRYGSHVADCKVCQDGLHFLKQSIFVCSILSQCSIVLALGIVFKASQSALPYWDAALPLIPFYLFRFIESHIKESWIPHFYFIDSIHTEKN